MPEKGHRPRHVFQPVDRGAGEAPHAGVVEVVVGAEDVRRFLVDLAGHTQDAGVLEQREPRRADHRKHVLSTKRSLQELPFRHTAEFHGKIASITARTNLGSHLGLPSEGKFPCR